MADVSLDRSASGSGPLLLGRSGGRERGQWSIPSEELGGGRRGSARAALLAHDKDDDSHLAQGRHIKGLSDLLSPSASPRAHVLSSPSWRELAEHVSDGEGGDTDEDGTGSRRITREEQEGALPADVVCVVEQLGSTTGNHLHKLWTPPAWDHRNSGTHQKAASLRAATTALTSRPTTELCSPAALSQSTGRVSSLARSPVTSLFPTEEQRLNMSTPVRGHRARRSPDLQRHGGHLAATAASLGKSTRTSRSAAIESLTSPTHQRRASTGGPNPSTPHRRQQSSTARVRSNMSLDMQDISENAVLDPIPGTQPATSAMRSSPNGPSVLRAAYQHLGQQLAQVGGIAGTQHELLPLPKRAREVQRQLYQRREGALRQALLAIEDVWATERAIRQMNEFGTAVVARSEQCSHAALMGAVESYLSIHERVRTWPSELGEGEDCGDGGLLTPSSVDGGCRRGGLMENTAAPHSKTRAGALTPTRPGSGLHRRCATLDMGNLDPSLLSVEAAERLAAVESTFEPKGRRCDDERWAKVPKGEAGRETMAEFLGCTEEWFVVNVAHALCDEVSGAEEGAGDPARAVQVLSNLKKVQDWVDGVQETGQADSPIAEMLTSLQGRLRDAVIDAGSQLVRK